MAVLLLAVMVTPAIVGGPIGSVAVTSSISNSGGRQLIAANFSGNATLTKSSIVNNVTYLVATTVRTVTGNMSGVLVAYEWGAIQANGSMWISGTGTFVGTILGSSPGLVTISWVKAIGIWGKSIMGTVFVSNGQKGLTGVHGSGPAKVYFTGGLGFDGSYAFHLDLD
jgi:hypothetical protein